MIKKRQKKKKISALHSALAAAQNCVEARSASRCDWNLSLYKAAYKPVW